MRTTGEQLRDGLSQEHGKVETAMQSQLNSQIKSNGPCRALGHVISSFNVANGGRANGYGLATNRPRHGASICQTSTSPDSIFQADVALFTFQEAIDSRKADVTTAGHALAACARSKGWLQAEKVMTLAISSLGTVSALDLQAILISCASDAGSSHKRKDQGMENNAALVAGVAGRILLDQAGFLQRRIIASSKGGIDIVLLGSPAATFVVQMVELVLNRLNSMQMQAGPVSSIVSGDVRVWQVDPQLLLDLSESESALEWRRAWNEGASLEDVGRNERALQRLLAAKLGQPKGGSLSFPQSMEEVPKNLLKAAGLDGSGASGVRGTLYTIPHKAIEDYVFQKCLASWNAISLGTKKAKPRNESPEEAKVRYEATRKSNLGKRAQERMDLRRRLQEDKGRLASMTTQERAEYWDRSERYAHEQAMVASEDMTMRQAVQNIMREDRNNPEIKRMRKTGKLDEILYGPLGDNKLPKDVNWKATGKNTLYYEDAAISEIKESPGRLGDGIIIRQKVKKAKTVEPDDDPIVLPGIGPTTSEKLKSAGFYTVAKLAGIPDDRVDIEAEMGGFPEKSFAKYINIARRARGIPELQ